MKLKKNWHNITLIGFLIGVALFVGGFGWWAVGVASPPVKLAVVGGVIGLLSFIAATARDWFEYENSHHDHA